MTDRQSERGQLRDDIDSLCLVGIFGNDKREFTTFHVNAERFEYVGHLIIQDIEDK